MTPPHDAPKPYLTAKSVTNIATPFWVVVALALKTVAHHSWLGTSDLRRLAVADDSSIGVWVGLALTAMLTKLTASTDDVVWLLPFLSGADKGRNIVFYITCMQLVVCMSWGFSNGGEKLLNTFVPEDSAWPPEKILQLISAVVLTIYTIKLLHQEWCQDRNGESEEGEKGRQPAEQIPPAAAEAGNDTLPSKQALQKMSDEVTRITLPDATSQLEFEVAWTVPHPTVACVVPGGAAAKLGLKAGDVLLELNGASTVAKQQAELAIALQMRPLMVVALEAKQAMMPVATSTAVAGSPATAPTDLEASDVVSPDQVIADIIEKAAPETTQAAAVEGRPEGPALVIADLRTDKNTLNKLFAISMIGSLDDFAVFVSLLLSGVLSAAQLCLGVLFGSVIVVAVCASTGWFDGVHRVVQKVPLWVVIGTFAIWTYVATFALE